MKELFESYFADNDTPLLISFANHLKNWGYSTEIDYDLWDLLAFKESDEPDIVVMTTKTGLRPNQVRNIASVEGPVKVILVEAGDLLVDDMLAMKLFMAKVNVALYFRGIGWVNYSEEHKNLGFRDWNYRLQRHYRLNEEGEWEKACSSCGEYKLLKRYYRRPRTQGTARDPYRNICLDCWKRKYKTKLDKPRITVV
jgi:hypothetical protein